MSDTAHMTWKSPLPLKLLPTREANSFQTMPDGWTGLPLAPHPGAFGVERKHHTHEGVDLYAPAGTPVLAVEDGRVVRIEPFTGEHAGSPWWHDTWAVFVEGATGVVVYGEITPEVKISENCMVVAGQVLGQVCTVLKTPKGRPASMLHLELHDRGARAAPGWDHGQDKPNTLQDPTPWLMALTD